MDSKNRANIKLGLMSFSLGLLGLFPRPPLFTLIKTGVCGIVIGLFMGVFMHYNNKKKDKDLLYTKTDLY